MGNSPDETQRKRVAMELKKNMKECHNWNWKDKKLRTNVQWTTLGCGCNEHWAIMKWTTLGCGHCMPKEGDCSLRLQVKPLKDD